MIAILMLSLGFASFSLVVQPGLAPSRTVGCAQAGVRLSPLRAGLFDVFKESVRNHTRRGPAEECLHSRQQPPKHDRLSCHHCAFQDADKARKEKEFQAIKDLAELRRNPQKMAAYEDEVRAHLVRLRARVRVRVKVRIRARLRVGGEGKG